MEPARPAPSLPRRSPWLILAPKSWFVFAPPNQLRFAYALAALFFVTSLGLSLWLMLERPAAEAGLGANLRLEDLHPLGSAIRRSDTRTIAAGAEDFVFILSASPADQVNAAGYQANITHQDGTTSWRLDPVKRSAEGYFTVRIPGPLLRPGQYAIEISTGGELVCEYRFEIEEP